MVMWLMIDLYNYLELGTEPLKILFFWVRAIFSRITGIGIPALRVAENCLKNRITSFVGTFSILCFKSRILTSKTFNCRIVRTNAPIYHFWVVGPPGISTPYPNQNLKYECISGWQFHSKGTYIYDIFKNTYNCILNLYAYYQSILTPPSYTYPRGISYAHLQFENSNTKSDSVVSSLDIRT